MTPAIADSGMVNLAVQVAVDSVMVGNWPPDPWYIRYSSVFQFAGVLAAGLIAFGVTAWNLRRIRTSQAESDRLKSYRLLSALCSEMKSALDRIWVTLEDSLSNQDPTCVIPDNARHACLRTYAELSQDPKTLNRILRFYEHIAVINSHGKGAARSTALNVMHRKSEVMTVDYLAVLGSLHEIAGAVGRQVPEFLQIPEEPDNKRLALMTVLRRKYHGAPEKPEPI